MVCGRMSKIKKHLVNQYASNMIV